MNNETKTLRDELAMNAPFTPLDWKALTDLEPTEENERRVRAGLATMAKLQYLYANEALRVRDETMPKVERVHPEWARWAARMPSGNAFYFSGKPSFNRDESYWIGSGSNQLVEGDTSFIPADWRKSLTPVNQ